MIQLTHCEHGATDGQCPVDGCRCCREWSIEKMIAAFDLSNIKQGDRVTIPYGQTFLALHELRDLRSRLDRRDEEWRHAIARALLENGISDGGGLLTIEPNQESMAFLIRLVMRLAPLRSVEVKL